MNNNYSMMSNDELAAAMGKVSDEFEKVKAECVKLSGRMTELSLQYIEMNKLLDKRLGKGDGTNE